MTGRQYAIEAVLRIADAVSGGEVIEVETAHISGVSYLTLGEYGVRFIESLASSGARASIFATSNPLGLDLNSVLQIPPEFAAGQRRVVDAFIKIGISPISTCAPYEFIKTRPGTAHAWAESNAITYINTFRDAWSDKNPGPLALLAAVAGFVPKTEMYRLDGRRPTALVKAEVEADALRAGLLGAYVGERLGAGVPYFTALGFRSEEAKREFAAALSTYSSMIFAVIERTTPNWRRYSELADFGDKLSISEEDLGRYLSGQGEPDAVYIGCPHLDLDTLLKIIRTVQDRGLAKKPIYISTSPGVYGLVKDAAESLRDKNVYIFAGSCLVISPYTRRFRTVATDSLKSVYYMPRLHGVRTIPCETLKCIEYAYS